MMMRLAKNDLLNNIPQYNRKIKLVTINIGNRSPKNDIGQNNLGVKNGET